MKHVVQFLLRLVMVVMALIFAASLAVALVLLLTFWALRAGWARLTGQPVVPFVMRMDPRSGFSKVYRARRGMQQPLEQGPATPGRSDAADVTDVEPKQPRS